MDSQLIKPFIPPFTIDFYHRYIDPYGFFGDYKHWQEAVEHSQGYGIPQIIEQVLKSSLNVKEGKALFERDGVCFYEPYYVWPLMTALLRIAAKNNNCLRVLDFGGSLGSLYFQHKKLLSELKHFRWCIVEQPAYVERGKKYFEDSVLRFYDSLSSCVKNEEIDVIVLSGVLQYLEKPHDVLNEIISHKFKTIVISRTPFIMRDNDRLTVQKVPPSIYKASYPAWFFNKKIFLEHFKEDYKILYEYEDFAGEVTIKAPLNKAIDMGIVFEK
ncbi:MAG: methyltransferase, TIGR04325 family [Candidatus Omnitrophota bacterium]|nr:methyltransferase, TIGR04325 family [Candidatus Omnitrophota bacterium]